MKVLINACFGPDRELPLISSATAGGHLFRSVTSVAASARTKRTIRSSLRTTATSSWSRAQHQATRRWTPAAPRSADRYSALGTI